MDLPLYRLLKISKFFSLNAPYTPRAHGAQMIQPLYCLWCPTPPAGYCSHVLSSAKVPPNALAPLLVMHQLCATQKSDTSHHRFSTHRLWKSLEPRFPLCGAMGNESAKKWTEASTYKRDPDVTLTAHDSLRPKTLLKSPWTQQCLDKGDGQQQGQWVRSNGDMRWVQLVQWLSPLMGHAWDAWVWIPWVLKYLDALHHCSLRLVRNDCTYMLKVIWKSFNLEGWMKWCRASLSWHTC